MKQLGHLCVYDMTLTTRAPVFIGSGQVYTKTDYLHDPRRNRVTVIDREKLFSLLLRHDLVDAYERFVLGGGQKLRTFLLQEGHIREEELRGLALYETDAADALDGNHSLKEIHAFVRNRENKVYVPGSSIKGALRTALLLEKMKNEQAANFYLERKTALPEGRYLNTLRYANDKKRAAYGNAVSSILQGVRISDSQMISDAHIYLATKIDASVNGSVKKLNLCRECLAPGTVICTTLTLDRSVVGDQLTVDTIRSAISEYSRYYQSTYAAPFRSPTNSIAVPYQNSLIIGGGAGFFSKTLIYHYYGERACRSVAGFMRTTFPKHKHDLDPQHGISPHTAKYTQYRGQLYPMGFCEVKIQ